MLNYHIQLLYFTNSRRQRYLGAFSTELRVTKRAQFAFAGGQPPAVHLDKTPLY